MTVWCVHHEDGWCAIEGNQPHDSDDMFVPTLCGYIVNVPFGCAQREPDCPECREKLAVTK